MVIRLTDKTPIGHIIGRKLLTYYSAAYVSKPYLDECKQNAKKLSWIIKNGESSLPDWVAETGYVNKNRHYIVNDLDLQLAATKVGIGASVLLCLVADQNPELQRLSPERSHPTRDIWILTYRDTPSIKSRNIYSFSYRGDLWI